MACMVCGGSEGVSEMTDGRELYPVCDVCRELVNLFFHVYGSLAEAIRQAQTAKGGGGVV
jgi:hypothetical protein